MDSIEIAPVPAVDATVEVPGSKSCTARGLVMAALTEGVTTLHGCARCDDADRLVEGLCGLGIPIERSGTSLTVEGRPFRRPAYPLFLGNSGTAVRFLTAACAGFAETVVIDGDARMRERPIADLVTALRAWGVDACAPTGCPPVTVRGTSIFGGRTCVSGSASSQYLSGLLMVAPRAQGEAVMEVAGDLVSKPYADLTIAMMQERGVSVEHKDYRVFRTPAPQRYRPGVYRIEADASGASYFLAAAAVTGGRVRVLRLGSSSRQGDAHFPPILASMGCTVRTGPDWTEVVSDGKLRGISVDLNAMPDMAQTIAVVALFAEGPTEIRNVKNLRIKECDRISATAAELRKLGAAIEEFDDGLRIVPPPAHALHGADIETYDDHRMAMSFAVAGLRIPGVRIMNPGCVSKTFPGFFELFAGLSGNSRRCGKERA